jgi:hypothetical protein
MFLTGKDAQLKMPIMRTWLYLVLIPFAAFNAFASNTATFTTQPLDTFSEATLSFAVYDSLGSQSPYRTTPAYWGTGYGDLTQIIYGATTTGVGTADVVSELTLTATTGTLSLDSFELAGWVSDRTAQVQVLDEDFNTLFDTGSAISIDGTTHTDFTPGTVGDVLRIRWTSGYYVGLDNVGFTAVPEPASMAAPLGLLLLTLARRRRC